ncbi:unnamed protein product [Didymodactylos carnosus]|nr:unnamed protein product [Didymodactylos carnosus]CAF3615233.1 unnamed protein product [Didymodactylos carnosus]
MLNILQKHAKSSQENITRSQAVNLLNTFYEAKIFSDVKDDLNVSKKRFVEDDRIYRLLPSTDENVFQSFIQPPDVNKQTTNLSPSPSSVFELMYAYAKQKRKYSFNVLKLFSH